MARMEVPDALKDAVPPTMWGRILAATPVVMTVLATALAGLSSSEMTRAQYSRSLAAQQQSKAGDQWGFFQAKRLRGAFQRTALDSLQLNALVRPLEAAVLDRIGVAPDSPAGRLTLAALQQGELPPAEAATVTDPGLRAALKAVEDQKPDAEIEALLAPVKDDVIAGALRAARERARALDAALEPVNRNVDDLEKALAGGFRWLARDFTAARLRYAATRYDAEARLNQAIANIHELQVRKSNAEANRHHRRSQLFFYGMLAAQAAVIIATFSLAARKRSLMWSLAAAAGVAAVLFAGYVYLFL